ncbi:MAG: DUF423 domain-containing protein [Pirellulales bacterium]
MFPRLCLVLAALLGASGVGLGAYHAHGLEKFLDRQALEPAVKQKRLDNCGTAVKYQLYHAVALIGLAAFAQRQTSRALQATAALWLLGVAGFSGGLYLMVFTGRIGHWSIVPAGGVALIAGWLALAAVKPTVAQASSL